MSNITPSLQFGLQPVVENCALISPRSNEEDTTTRRSFVNRKENKFTYSTRYLYTGRTNNGKKWTKWRTLQALSVTIKNNKVNLFLIGSTGTRTTFMQVVNISRHTYIVDNIVGPPGNPTHTLFMSELTALANRTGLTTRNAIDVTLPASIALTKVIYPAWAEIFDKAGNPKMTYRNHVQLPAAFITQIMRTESIEEIINRLTAPYETKLQAALSADPEILSDNRSLFFLLLTRKIYTEGERLSNIQDHRTATKNRAAERDRKQKSSSLNMSVLDSLDLNQNRLLNNITPNQFASLREIFKKVSPKSRTTMIYDMYHAYGLETLATTWNVNKYALKRAAKDFSLAQKEIKTWYDAEKILLAEVARLNAETSSDEIKNELEKEITHLSSLPYLKVKRRKLRRR